jgi:tetratricopeptide (TPR) repeat protein
MPAAASLLTRAAGLSAAARRAVVTELAAALLETGELEQAAALLDQTLAEARATGDERTAAITALARANLAGHRGESASMERVIELAGKAEAVLERDGDDAQLAAVLVIEGRHRFFSGRSREGVAVLERAFELALGAGNLPSAQEALTWIWAVKTFGSASVSECRGSFAQAPAQLSETLSGRLWLMMHAGLVDGFAGDFSRAREQLAEANALADELGAWTTSAALTMYAGFVELLADDPAAAERELRDGYDRLGAIGESGYRSSVATMLADALVELGRETEAAEVLDTAESLAQGDDIDPQVRLRAVRGRVLARRGELAEAERVAREGVAVAAATDYIVQHGDALLALAAVLDAKGAHDEAVAARRQALELFEKKEAVPRVAQVRELLRAGEP